MNPLRRIRRRADAESASALRAHPLPALLPPTTGDPAGRAAGRPTTTARSERVAPARGWNSPYAGRANTVCRPVVWRASSDQLAGLYPFLYGSGLPPVGAYIGRDTVTLAAFAAHPTAWVQLGLTPNPNLIVTGTPGSGKSANLKALALRLMPFGTRTVIAGDVKGEYNALCDWLGAPALRLGPGIRGRLNPLDAGPLGVDVARAGNTALAAAWRTEIHRRRLMLLTTLLELQLHRGLEPEETQALSVAIRHTTGELYGSTSPANPTIPAVYAALLDPSPDMARELRVRGEDPQLLRELTLKVRSALAAMVGGHLGGIFDSATTTPLDWDAPICSVDISRLTGYGDTTVAMVLTCLSSWVQAALDQPGPPRLVIRDELWRALRAGGATTIRKVDSDLRLSRYDGAMQAICTHYLADFESVGALGSEAVTIAREFVASCGIKLTCAQDVGQLSRIREEVGLTDAACGLVSAWGRAHPGRGLWKVGVTGTWAVQLVLSEIEKHLFYTDERMQI